MKNIFAANCWTVAARPTTTGRDINYQLSKIWWDSLDQEKIVEVFDDE